MNTPALLVLSVGLLLGVDRPKNEPGPEKAVPGIVKLFDKYSVVAIGEFHGYGELGELYTALVRDPAFQGKVNDIVIEFASRHNQPILDRYILKCEDVPLDELRRVWRDTSKATHSWESPLYTGWLEAIRDANKKLPAASRMRVLVGDTPIDWAKIKKHEDWLALGASDVSFAKVGHRGGARLISLGAKTPSAEPIRLPPPRSVRQAHVSKSFAVIWTRSWLSTTKRVPRSASRSAFSSTSATGKPPGTCRGKCVGRRTSTR